MRARTKPAIVCAICKRGRFRMPDATAANPDIATPELMAAISAAFCGALSMTAAVARRVNRSAFAAAVSSFISSSPAAMPPL